MFSDVLTLVEGVFGCFVVPFRDLRPALTVNPFSSVSTPFVGNIRPPLLIDDVRLAVAVDSGGDRPKQVNELKMGKFP